MQVGFITCVARPVAGAMAKQFEQEPQLAGARKEYSAPGQAGLVVVSLCRTKVLQGWLDPPSTVSLRREKATGY